MEVDDEIGGGGGGMETQAVAAAGGQADEPRDVEEGAEVREECGEDRDGGREGQAVLEEEGESEAPDAKRQRMERCPTDHAQPPWYLRMDGEMPQAGSIRWKAAPPRLQRQHQLQQQLLQQQQLQQQQPHNPNVQ